MALVFAHRLKVHKNGTVCDFTILNAYFHSFFQLFTRYFPSPNLNTLLGTHHHVRQVIANGLGD